MVASNDSIKAPLVGILVDWDDPLKSWANEVAKWIKIIEKALSVVDKSIIEKNIEICMLRVRGLIFLYFLVTDLMDLLSTAEISNICYTFRRF